MIKIELQKCGSKCKILNEITGIITGINIRYSKIQYEVTNIKNDATCAKWYDEEQITFNKNNKITVGFKEN